jgi:bacterioferritin-associated ferredoxin
MTPTEKAIRDFCGHHADWWPSTTQVQEMLALAQSCPTCEALARTVMLDQTSHDAQRKPLTENEIKNLWYDACQTNLELTSQLIVHLARNIEAAHGIKE